ncbi:GNAT family N-acetyltransferase [Pseudomonas multiresinivorans]|uniref:GNAT family N-acetyltransferase n=1 Tax=Pseudomonas multiresinivorans TaxID=95301 RepID=UPI0030B89294
MELMIRQAHSDDAKAISQVIVAAVRESNGQDYPASVIESVVAHFTPERLIELLKERLIFVALLNDQIVGTGALDGNAVRSLFIAPQQQRKGIGQALMRRIEKAALERGIEALLTPLLSPLKASTLAWAIACCANSSTEKSAPSTVQRANRPPLPSGRGQRATQKHPMAQRAFFLLQKQNPRPALADQGLWN